MEFLLCHYTFSLTFRSRAKLSQIKSRPGRVELLKSTNYRIGVGGWTGVLSRLCICPLYFPSFEVDAASKVDAFERGLTRSSGDPACWPRPFDVVYLPLRQQIAIHLLVVVIFSFFPRYFIQMLSIIHISRIFGNWCTWQAKIFNWYTQNRPSICSF